MYLHTNKEDTPFLMMVRLEQFGTEAQVVVHGGERDPVQANHHHLYSAHP